MIGIYFSGTGNSRYALEFFLKEYDKTARIFAVEDEIVNKQSLFTKQVCNASSTNIGGLAAPTGRSMTASVLDYIKDEDVVVFSYSVQYSNIPKMLKDFVDKNQYLWKDKKIFVIATMGLFSGDGAGILARRLHKYGAQIIGGLHLKMPDSIADEKALKRPIEKNKELVKAAERKIHYAVQDMKSGKPPQEGIGLMSHLAGLFGQRLYFYNKTEKYTDKVKVDSQKCVGCGKCVSLCMMKNLHIEKKMAIAEDRCTMCYRCINVCPKQAITLLGKNIIEQGTIEKYL